jgi:hypothetical protein
MEKHPLLRIHTGYVINRIQIENANANPESVDRQIVEKCRKDLGLPALNSSENEPIKIKKSDADKFC